MALRYVIKKRTFGFDKTKAEKYVARGNHQSRNGPQWSGKICT